MKTTCRHHLPTGTLSSETTVDKVDFPQTEEGIRMMQMMKDDTLMEEQIWVSRLSHILEV